MTQDTGHENLIKDLETLIGELNEILREAKDFGFHDFKNRKYALPKIMLKSKLDAISNSVVEGKYDNIFYGQD
jgi:hypothetical protein